MPLHIHSSNRMETLVATLAEKLRKPLASPFTPELIVMQSGGMQRWLAMELAERFGIWAHCSYPFPNAMVWQLFNAIFPQTVDAANFSPENLTWKIISLLPGYRNDRSFSSLIRYLDDDSDGMKCYQLACRIADTFDQYTLFRPDMLARWERGEIPGEGDGRWQAILWRRLLQEFGTDHRGRLLERYCNAIRNGNVLPSQLPERISLFGISYLPPYHLQIFDATAVLTDVHLFLLSPTGEYWGDIVGRRTLARQQHESEPVHHHGSPLLGSFGTIGRQFSEMTFELQQAICSEGNLYHEPLRNSLLHALQSDIATIDERPSSRQKQPVNKSDHSLQLASCHSPLREIEELHNFLLDRFTNDSTLEPRHVVVMTPDIERYAPYISAVFGTTVNATQRIPFSIADRSLGKSSEIVSILLQIMQLPGSRCSSAQLFDLLSSPPVLQRFGLTGQQLEQIRSWLVKTGIRWGINAAERSALGLPEYHEHSWRAGLDRLLLGYAMPEGTSDGFAGIVPFDALEGTAAGTLGMLIDFIETVSSISRELNAPRRLGQWEDALRHSLNSLVADDYPHADELAALHEILAQLSGLEQHTGHAGMVSLPMIRSWLTSRLDENRQGHGFLSGGVTFCAMLPMRSIPFKLVALLGMSDGSFPRQSQQHSFDLMAQQPRPGDRSLRDEDRYLFLEALLSARDTLYISYVGQSIIDGSDVPPSVIVSELLDAIDHDYCREDGQPLSSTLLTRHRLQPFSRDYFTPDSPLFSYSRENLQALQLRLQPEKVRPFITRPLPPPEATLDLPLPQLLRFFRNPAGYFLQSRFGIRFQEQHQLLEEREPFELDALQQYGVRQLILDGMLSGKSPDTIRRIASANGMIPPAEHGTLLFNQLWQLVTPMADQLAALHRQQTRLTHLDCSVSLPALNINGRLPNIWPETMIRYRHATLKGNDLVAAWIEHLLLNAMNTPGYPTETILLMNGAMRRFLTVDNAEEYLNSLAEMYLQGQCRPLPYFPQSSHAYAINNCWNTDKARTEWNRRGNDIPSESDDPAFALCFGTTDPLDEEFQLIARSIYEPLFAHCQEVKYA